MFEQGDLKYVILKLLDEKPRHGYDIMKELEEKSGGAYAPSAGTVYPTLQMLEDMGFASVQLEEGGRKVYSITEAGRSYLQQNKPAVEEVFDRFAELGKSILSDEVMEINRALRDLAAATYGPVRSYYKDAELAGSVREIIQRAVREVREAVERRSSTGGTA